MPPSVPLLLALSRLSETMAGTQLRPRWRRLQMPRLLFVLRLPALSHS
jgi:hypothetical protein